MTVEEMIRALRPHRSDPALREAVTQMIRNLERYSLGTEIEDPLVLSDPSGEYAMTMTPAGQLKIQRT